MTFEFGGGADLGDVSLFEDHDPIGEDQDVDDIVARWTVRPVRVRETVQVDAPNAGGKPRE